VIKLKRTDTTLDLSQKAKLRKLLAKSVECKGGKRGYSQSWRKREKGEEEQAVGRLMYADSAKHAIYARGSCDRPHAVVDDH
jgi:hypothetical protein